MKRNLMHRTLISTTVAVALLAAGSAHAGFVYVDDVAPASSTVAIGDVNEFRMELAGGGATEYTVGATIALDAPGTVVVDYFGKEAIFENRFEWAGATIGTTPAAELDPWSERRLGTFDVAGSGPLDFAFCTSGGDGVGGFYPAACRTNVDADAATLDPDQSIGSWLSADGGVAWLLWDDGGGGGANSHDDMVIRLTYAPAQVPEPATLGLLGAGLLAAALGRRRRPAS